MTAAGCARGKEKEGEQGDRERGQREGARERESEGGRELAGRQGGAQPDASDCKRWWPLGHPRRDRHVA